MASSFRRALNGAVVSAGVSLSGCGFLFPELDFPIDAISQQGIGPVIIAVLLDGTEQYGGAQGMHCSGGTYRGGGDKNNEDNTEKALDKREDALKDDIKAMDRASDQCKGKTKSAASYDQAAGCDRGRHAALITQASAQGASAGAVQDFHAADANCAAADRTAAADPCSEANSAARQAARNRRANDLKDVEGQKSRFENCSKDRERQAGTSQTPAVTPTIVITPGMFSRPPQRRQEPSHGSRPSTQPAPKPSTSHKSYN